MRAFRGLASFMMVVTLGACVAIPNFETGYQPTTFATLSPVANGGLVVFPFEDQRPERETGSQLDLHWAAVPLLPFFRSDFERYEETIRDRSLELQLTHSRGPLGQGGMKLAPYFKQYGYPRSMAQAVARDLRESGLFDTVDFVDDPDSSLSQRFALHGVLHETPLRRRYSSWGLGFPGVYLWIIPLPMARVSATVVLDLTLVERSSGEVVWFRSISGDAGRFFTIYHRSLAYGPNGSASLDVYMIGDNQGVDPESIFSWHFAALRDGMAAAKPDLARTLKAD